MNTEQTDTDPQVKTAITGFTEEKLLDSLFEGLYFVDLNKNISFWNRGAERITGYSRAEIVGRCCADNLLRHLDQEGNELCISGCPLSATLLDGNLRDAQVFIHHKLGHRIPVHIRITPVRDDMGNISGAIELFTDNSNPGDIIKELEDLKKEAYLDPLTGIGNRRYGEMSLSTRFYDLKNNGIPLGIMFLDIDHFKRFNDIFGHKTGDDVLVMVANSISGTLRKIDVVTRWGGEEFVIILPGATAGMLVRVAERIRMVIEHSFIIAEEEKHHVTASIGATLATAEDTPESLVARADALMYRSKNSGRNCVTSDCTNL